MIIPSVKKKSDNTKCQKIKKKVIILSVKKKKVIILSIKKFGAIFSFVVVFLRNCIFLLYILYFVLYFQLLLPGAEIKVYKNSNIFLSFLCLYQEREFMNVE